MNFVHLKMELCNSKLCTQWFAILYCNIWNFILLCAKFIIKKIVSKHIQHGSTFIDLVIMNVMVQTKLKIDAWQESCHILKFICRLQMQKKQIWHTARGPLLSPRPPSTLGPHSPCAAILWILHAPRVRTLLYGLAHAHRLVIGSCLTLIKKGNNSRMKSLLIKTIG
jgi:hypothetical protein